MNRKVLWILWIVLFVGCVALSAFCEAGVFTGFVGVCFFAPPALLLVQGIRDGNRKTVRIVRYLALASLLLTTFSFGGVIATVQSGETAQKLTNVALMLFGAPVMCFRSAAASLLLWAGLLFGSFVRKKG